MKAKDIIRVSCFVVLLLLPSVVTISVYSQTYEEWLAEGWNLGCEDKKRGSLNNTEGRNTPFIKGYNLGFAECSPSNVANATAVTNMTQETDGDKTQVTSTGAAYDIGCADVGLSGGERYITQPGNEPSSQTEEFMKEYYAGYYGCGGTFPAEEGPQPEPPSEASSSRTNPSESTSPPVSESSQYDRGYNYGCDERTYRTENHPSGLSEGYTDEFIRGYYDGFAGCDSAVPPSSQPSDTQSPTNTQYAIGHDMGCDEATSGATESKTLGELEGYTDEFVQGYNDGFTWCNPAVTPEPQPRDTQSPNTQPPVQRAQSPSTQPPMQGDIDWITVCNNLQSALVSSCNVLVKPDNTLTTEGERAVGCIRNGIALAGGGTLLGSLPLPLIIAALKALETPTGCGGIVNWDAIGSVGDIQGIINLLK